MLISTETGSLRALGCYENVLKCVKEAGFTAYDCSLCGSAKEDILLLENYKERAEEIRKFADSIGLPCNQTHAPFPTARPNETEENKVRFAETVKALEISGILGAKVCVVHPCNFYSAEENYELYKSFEPYARKFGVKIGVENMWNWANGGVTTAACSHHDDFRKHLELLPSDVFVACLDIGHSEMGGLNTSAVEMVRVLGERLEAIHLHDVDLVNDNHSLPFTQKINFIQVIEEMRKIGYKGDITLESINFFAPLPKELLPAALKYAATVANYFANELLKN